MAYRYNLLIWLVDTKPLYFVVRFLLLIIYHDFLGVFKTNFMKQGFKFCN